jgi:hypothetical protein
VNENGTSALLWKCLMFQDTPPALISTEARVHCSNRADEHHSLQRLINEPVVERAFSSIKDTTKDRRNRLGLEKTEKTLKVSVLHRILYSIF